MIAYGFLVILPWAAWLTSFLEWVESLGHMGNFVLAFAFVVISFPFTIGYIPLSLSAGSHVSHSLSPSFKATLFLFFLSHQKKKKKKRLLVWSGVGNVDVNGGQCVWGFSVLHDVPLFVCQGHVL